jgi:hypothetical protein
MGPPALAPCAALCAPNPLRALCLALLVCCELWRITSLNPRARNVALRRQFGLWCRWVTRSDQVRGRTPRCPLTARGGLTNSCRSSPNDHPRAHSKEGDHTLSFDFHFAERFPLEIAPDALPNIFRDRDASGYGLLHPAGLCLASFWRS